MDLLPLFQSAEATYVGTKVRESLWMFPVIECMHLIALAMMGGAVLAVDLRVFGIGLRSIDAPDLEATLRPWLAGSVILLFLTGIPMFLSEAIKCYYSPPFWYKMGLLTVATIFAFTVRRQGIRAVRAFPNVARVTAVASLSLWFGVAFAGRWIAFY